MICDLKKMAERDKTVMEMDKLYYLSADFC